MAKSDLDILFLPLNAALPRTQLEAMVESRLSPDHPVVGIDRCHRRIDRCVPAVVSQQEIRPDTATCPGVFAFHLD
jgi:hypothetical protein